MIYAIAVMVVGKLLFGFILGSIASTLANLDTQRVLFEEKLNALKVSTLILYFETLLLTGSQLLYTMPLPTLQLENTTCNLECRFYLASR